MKRLLSILLLFISFGALAQTYDTLPTGSKPYGNQLYLTPSGLIVGGTGSAKFRVIGTKKYVDSLLALKADVSQLILKANTSDVVLKHEGYGENTSLLAPAIINGNGSFTSITAPTLAQSNNSTNLATTAFVKGAISAIPPTDLTPFQLKSEKSQANGYASLDGSGKVPLTQINDALLGAVNYRGTYNAATNSPALPTVASSNKGYYWIISTAGNQFGLDFRVGDWIISNGSSYGKVASSSDVESVAGKKGVVTLNKYDVNLGNVDNTSDILKPLSNPMNAALALKADISSLASGQTIGATTTGGSDFAYRLRSYNGGNNIHWGWDGNAFTAKVDNTDFGNSIPLNITGGAGTATKWDNQEYGRNESNVLNAFFLGYGLDGKWHPTNINAAKTALGTSLQDVTSVGANANNNVTFRNPTNDIGLEIQRDGIIPNIQGANNASTTARDITLQSFGGNVGIGLGSPTQKLDVNGNIQGNAQFFNGTTTTGLITPMDGDVLIMEAFNKGNSTKFPISLNPYGGNVGIGKLTPGQKLDVNGAIRTNERLIVDKLTGGLGIDVTNGADATFKIGVTAPGAANKYGWIGSDVANQPLIINPDNGGNVGIATTNPLEKLTVTNGKLFLTTDDYTLGGKIYGYRDQAVNSYDAGLKFQSMKYNGSTYQHYDAMTLNGQGILTIASLSGTGSAPIVADANGTFRRGVATNGTVTNVQLSGDYGIIGTVSSPTTTPVISYKADTASANGLVSKTRLASTYANGTYTPSMTNIYNATSITPLKAQYTRVGNIVTVYGAFTLTTSVGSNNTIVTMSIPIASNLNTDGDANGIGVALINTATSYPAVSVEANGPNKVQLVMTPAGVATNFRINYNYSYIIK